MVINIFLLKSNAMKIIGEIDDKPKIILFINFIVCLVHMKWCHTSPSYIIKHWMCRKCLWNEMILLNNKSENVGIQSISICWCVKAIVFIGWKMSGFNSWCDWIFESRRNVLVWIECACCESSTSVTSQLDEVKMWQLLQSHDTNNDRHKSSKWYTSIRKDDKRTKVCVREKVRKLMKTRQM